MKKRGGKSAKGHLEDDEAALWHHTTRSVEPLKKAKSRVHAAEAREDEPRRPIKSRDAEHQSAELSNFKSQKVEPRQPKKSPPPLAEFDRGKIRKLRSGRAEIEARIDLHGMRQDEAHMALRGFLRRAQDRELRTVLVITGKGRTIKEGTEEPFEMSRARDRGVLKRLVPLWLEEPDLRHLVVSYTTAAIGHGGEGALYVHLRRRR